MNEHVQQQDEAAFTIEPSVYNVKFYMSFYTLVYNWSRTIEPTIIKALLMIVRMSLMMMVTNMAMEDSQTIVPITMVGS